MNMWFIFGLFRFRSHEDDLPRFLEVARPQFYIQFVNKDKFALDLVVVIFFKNAEKITNTCT